MPSHGTAALWRALSPDRRPPTRADLEPIVQSAWRRATAAHPRLEISADVFFTFVGERISEAGELAARHVADLYLVCGCAARSGAAIAILEEAVWPAVERGLRGFKLTADARRDLVQTLREQMLVPHGGRGIGGYDGRAPLVVWLRVCAARLAQRQLVRARRASDLEDSHLVEIARGVPDPRLAYFKRQYARRFRVAFAEALAALSVRQRNLLRYAVLDGLAIDQIAAIYHVHRATAARQIRQARDELIRSTRDRMRAALRVSESEFESIMRMFTSMADITLRQELGRRT